MLHEILFTIHSTNISLTNNKLHLQIRLNNEIQTTTINKKIH